MKKFVKTLFAICLCFVAVSPVFLAGCAKTFKINVEVEGNGFVYKAKVEGVSIVGTNTAKKGSTFEYFVSPKTGYIIDKVIIDGTEYTEEYNREKAYFSFKDVNANHTVKVIFAAGYNTITLKCKTEDNVYEVYKTLSVLTEDTIDFNEEMFGGVNNKFWFKMEKGKAYYLYNDSQDFNVEPTDPNYEKNIVHVYGGAMEFYTNLTRTDLDQLAANAARTK